MCKSITIIFSVLMVCANGRYLIQEDYRSPYVLVEDGRNIRAYDLEEALSQDPQLFRENNLSRVRRQAHGTLSSNPDGTSNFKAKVPLSVDEENILSAVGTISGASDKGDVKAVGGGLTWENVDRHGASLTGQHKPEFGDQLTAAGKYNLLHEDKHDITAQAFATRTFPSNPNIPNSDTYGGNIGYTYDDKHGVNLGGQHIPNLGNQFTATGKFNLLHNDEHDITAQAFATRTFPSNPTIPNFDIYGGKVGYTYDDKLGASLGVQHNDLFRKTDYSAMGNYNLFKGPDYSLDFNAGLSKSVSPYRPNSDWEKSGAFSFTKWF